MQLNGFLEAAGKIVPLNKIKFRIIITKIQHGIFIIGGIEFNFFFKNMKNNYHSIRILKFGFLGFFYSKKRISL